MERRQKRTREEKIGDKDIEQEQSDGERRGQRSESTRESSREKSKEVVIRTRGEGSGKRGTPRERGCLWEVVAEIDRNIKVVS